jgi:hypothetical protein
MTVPMIRSEIDQKLAFARRRLDDIIALIEDRTFGMEVDLRHQLVQEFFFHLIGAAELVAQFVNQERSLGVRRECVKVTEVAKKIVEKGDAQLSACLRALYRRTRESDPMPADEYNDDGALFRAYNYRNEATHRRRLGYFFSIGAAPQALPRDPRDPNSKASKRPLREDLEHMLRVFEERCYAALRLV